MSFTVRGFVIGVAWALVSAPLAAMRIVGVFRTFRYQSLSEPPTGRRYSLALV